MLNWCGFDEQQHKNSPSTVFWMEHYQWAQDYDLNSLGQRRRMPSRVCGCESMVPYGWPVANNELQSSSCRVNKMIGPRRSTVPQWHDIIDTGFTLSFVMWPLAMFIGLQWGKCDRETSKSGLVRPMPGCNVSMISSRHRNCSQPLTASSTA